MNGWKLLCIYSVCGFVCIQAVGASVRVFELLDRHSAVTDGRLQLGALKGEIQFDDVMFNYPSRPDNTVLKVCQYRICVLLLLLCVCVCVSTRVRQSIFTYFIHAIYTVTYQYSHYRVYHLRFTQDRW